MNKFKIEKTKDGLYYYQDFYDCNCKNCIYDSNKEADIICKILDQAIDLKYSKYLICDKKKTEVTRQNEKYNYRKI